MAKSRAQRKAEARKRRAQQAEGKDPQAEQARAQHDTQVPESADVKEAELAIEEGAAEASRTTDAPAPSRADVGRPEDADGAGKRPSRRERRRQEKQEAERARAQAERRAPKEVTPERERGAVMAFFASVVKELQKVQWPDRDTLLQASAVTLIFVAIAAGFLGGMDAIFSRLIDLII